MIYRNGIAKGISPVNKNKHCKFAMLVGILFIAIFMLIGCSILPSTPLTPPVAPTVAYTMTSQPFIKHEITLSPLPTVTEFASPIPTTSSLPTQTPTPTVAPTIAVVPSLPTLSVAEEITFELVNQWGGQTESVAIVDDTAYLGMGPRLIILNIVNPTTPELLGQSQVFPNVVHAVLVQDGVAYLGVGASVISLDVSNPQFPILLGEMSLPGSVTHLALNKATLAVGSNFLPSNTYENGLGILTTISIDQSDQLQVLDSVTLPWYINAMALTNETVYVSNPADDTFYTVNISNPASLPDPVAFPGMALTYSLQAQDQTLYIGGGLSDISAWDISASLEPQKLWEAQARPHSNFGLGVVKGFILMENLAYLGVVSYHGQMIGLLPLEIPHPVQATQAGLVSSRTTTRNGYVFLAESGLAIYDISDSLNIVQVGAYTHPDVWDVATIGNVGVFVDGNRQEISNSNRLYTVSLPDLNIIGQYSDEMRCQQCDSSFVQLTITDSIAYVSALDDGLREINLADLSHPELMGSLDITNGFGDLRIGSVAVEKWVYGAADGYCNGRNLMAFDLSNSQAPQHISSIEVEGCVQQLAISNGILYVATTYADREGGAIYLLDIVGAEPQQLGLVTFSNGVNDIQILDDIVVVATSVGINTVSTNNPATPQIIGELSIPGGAYEATMADDVALVTTVDETSNGLLAIDLSEPSTPHLVGIFNLPAKGEISLAGDYLLVGNQAMGLVVLQMRK